MVALAAVLVVTGQTAASSTVLHSAPVGELAVDDLQSGDCISRVPVGNWLTRLSGVPCSHPHRAQVLGSARLSGSRYERSRIKGESLDECGQQVRATFPFALEDSAVSLVWLQPSASGWNEGDRTVTCILATDEPRAGSYGSPVS